MRYSRTRYLQAVELLGEIFEFAEPTERVVEKYFRRHRKMGAKDRRSLANIVYLCVRRKLELQTLVELSGVSGVVASEAIPACGLLRYFEWQPEDFLETAAAEFIEVLHHFLQGVTDDILTFPQKFSLPEWLFQALKNQYSEAELQSLCLALLQPAQVDIRVNSQINSRNDVLRILELAKIEATPTPLATSGVRVQKRGPLQNLKSFRAGGFEFQDEGSQLIGWLADPKPGQMVVDYCAGAGGKTLHLAELQNKGRLIACDVYANRLERLAVRLTRSRVSIVETLLVDAETGTAMTAPELLGQADCVLVDAPCSGVGTLRRNAGLKWIGQDLDELVAVQLQILAHAATLVKPGGVLVYATCSLLEAENQQVINAFLKTRDDFHRSEHGRSRLDPEMVNISAIDSSLANSIYEYGELVLRPDIHGTDGFYAQRLVKR